MLMYRGSFLHRQNFLVCKQRSCGPSIHANGSSPLFSGVLNQPLWCFVLWCFEPAIYIIVIQRLYIAAVQKLTSGFVNTCFQNEIKLAFAH